MFGANGSFAWFKAASGSFNDPNSWEVLGEETFNANGTIKDPNPNKKFPRDASDSVNFAGDAFAAYQVNMGGGEVNLFTVAYSFGAPSLTQPITFNLSGTMSAENVSARIPTILTGSGELYGKSGSTPNQAYDMTVKGGSSLRLENGTVKYLNVLDNSTAILSDIEIVDELLKPKEGINLTESTLKTSGKISGARVNLNLGSLWEHTGNELNGNLSMLGGSRFASEGNVTFNNLELRESSSFTAGSLTNPVKGISVSGSGLFAKTAVVQGGTIVFFPVEIMFPVDITKDSKVEFANMELAQGWLRISDRAKLKTGTAKMGTKGAAGVFVVDSGSEWTATNYTDSAVVRVRNGGLVQFASVVNKLSATVEGGGSKLEFGSAFNANLLLASTAGVIHGESIDLRGGSCSSFGSAILLSDAFNLGLGISSEFSITDNGFVGCDTSVMGIDEGGFASMTVKGDSSAWRIHKSLSIGGESATASLSIENGGTVMLGPLPTEEPVTIGGDSTVSVSGAKSEFDTRSALKTLVGIEPGFPRGPAKVTVSSGGAFRAGTVVLGPESAGEGVLTLDGPGSELEVQRTLIVGNPFGKGTIEIRNGATGKTSFIQIGNSAKDNRVLVTGAGSALEVTNSLLIGLEQVGTLTIADRAKLTQDPEGGALAFYGNNVIVGLSRVAKGTFVVDGGSSATKDAGASSSADLSGRPLFVGFAGKGTLTVSGGGSLNVLNCYLGCFSSSSAEALIAGQTGSGFHSNMRIEKDLVVGGFSDVVPATLDVTDSALVTVGETVRITPKGTVRLNNGRVAVGAADDPAPGKFVVGKGGTLIFEPGANLFGFLIMGGGNITTRNPPPAPAAQAPSPRGLRAAGDSSAMRAMDAANDVATIQGSVSMTGGGTITVEIDPANASSTQPALRVTGDVILGGKLTIQFAQAFAPVIGQKFNLFDFQSKVTGQFAQIEVVGLAPGFQYELKPDLDGLYKLSALNAGVAISLPRLSIVRTTAQLTVSWAATAKGYVLQSAPSVGTSNWQTVSTTSTQYTVPLPESDMFFRLVRP